MLPFTQLYRPFIPKRRAKSVARQSIAPIPCRDERRPVRNVACSKVGAEDNRYLKHATEVLGKSVSSSEDPNRQAELLIHSDLPEKGHGSNGWRRQYHVFGLRTSWKLRPRL
uniref:Uncharacterized protein n=1 Tax=Bionectria ochroleuca TaxID=29856 RepID=A0A8H7NI75_BIOOC